VLPDQVKAAGRLRRGRAWPQAPRVWPQAPNTVQRGAWPQRAPRSGKVKAAPRGQQGRGIMELGGGDGEGFRGHGALGHGRITGGRGILVLLPSGRREGEWPTGAADSGVSAGKGRPLRQRGRRIC
jgi:hypothetical protein